jgi:hypothetical protein
MEDTGIGETFLSELQPDATRAGKKAQIRAAVLADFKTRFPNLRGTKLRSLTKTKVDMLLAEALRIEAQKKSEEAQKEYETDLEGTGAPAGLESSPMENL